MLLNVRKGRYLSLGQVDEELVLSSSETIAVQRGSCLYRDDNGEWRVAGVAQAGTAAAAGEVIYFALQAGDDLTALMAGGVPGSDLATEPKIGALSCTDAMTIETDMFSGEPAVGDLLAVGANGRLVVHADGQTAVAKCTKAPYVRWVNNAVAVPNFRTGANVTAIEAMTVWSPNTAV